MAETKTYSLICPDLDCLAEFDIERTIEQLQDDGELIACPDCTQEWEWNYDEATGELTLLPGEEEDGEEEDGEEEGGEEDDDDEDDDEDGGEEDDDEF